MPTSKLLQKPTILNITGSTIRIQHPDVASYVKTTVSSPLSAGGTTLNVRDNNGFADNDWFIIGEIGDEKTESCDVNGAVTRGGSMTINNFTTFDHEIDAPVTKVLERGIKIYGASTDGGSGTLIASIGAIGAGDRQIEDSVMINWNEEYTEYTLISTDTTYAYYYAVFTDGTTDGSASDYVLAAGLGNSSIEQMVQSGLGEVNADIDGDMITREWLLTVANDFQDEVSNYVTADGVQKDWSFEMFEDKSSITLVENVNEYELSSLSSTLKFSDTYQSLLNVRIGTKVINYKDISQFDRDMEGRVNSPLASAASAGDTTLQLDDTYEFSESGSLTVPGQTDIVTYTANNESTGTLSGIPASGAGAITVSSIAEDALIWQGVNSGMPEYYTVFDGKIMFNVPVDADRAGYKLRVRAVKKLPRLTSFSSTTTIPFTYLAKYYFASRIEARKGNSDESISYQNMFRERLEMEAIRDGLPTLETFNHKKFDWDSQVVSDGEQLRNDQI